jgi:hypothetical protein
VPQPKRWEAASEELAAPGIDVGDDKLDQRAGRAILGVAGEVENQPIP